MAGLFGPITAALAEDPTEYQVKAAFLYKFGHFVTWPGDCGAAEDQSLLISLWKQDPFGESLSSLIVGKQVQGRPLELQKVGELKDIPPCSVLFVSDSAPPPGLVEWAVRNHVLTVGDREAFALQGGVIGFYIDGDKVRFAINPAAARASGLELSSRLLKVARLVNADENKR